MGRLGHNHQHTIVFVAGITLVIVFPLVVELHYRRPLSWWVIWIFAGWCVTLIGMWFLNYRIERRSRILMRGSMADEDEKNKRI